MQRRRLARPSEDQRVAVVPLTWAGQSGNKLRGHTIAFCDVRNAVAHHFHLRSYDGKISAFVERVLGTPCPASGEERRAALIDGVYYLAGQIAVCLDTIPQRGKLPFPMLSLELASDNPRKK